MHKLIFTVLTIISLKSNAQLEYNKELLDTLHQIKTSNTIAKHFATIYFQTIEIANKFMSTKNTHEITFVEKFEAKNVPYFFQSFQNFKNQLPQTNFWQFYYAYPNLNEMQYKFIGMNAHINGDMANAIINAHPYDSIMKHKKQLLHFQKVFNKYFDSIYKTTYTYKKIKRIHNLTLGLDKYIGRRMVYQWRKNAVRRALLWYSNPKKYAMLRKKTDKKMIRLNQLALRWIK